MSQEVISSLYPNQFYFQVHQSSSDARVAGSLCDYISGVVGTELVFLVKPYYPPFPNYTDTDIVGMIRKYSDAYEIHWKTSLSISFLNDLVQHNILLICTTADRCFFFNFNWILIFTSSFRNDIHTYEYINHIFEIGNRLIYPCILETNGKLCNKLNASSHSPLLFLNYLTHIHNVNTRTYT